MIRREAAKIAGRQGRGEKRQRKKEAPAGTGHDADENPRIAGEAAADPVHPDKKEKSGRKEEKARNIRHIAGIGKPGKEVAEEIHEQVRHENFTGKPMIRVTDGMKYPRDPAETVSGDIPSKVSVPDIVHVPEHVRLLAHIPHKEGSDEAGQHAYEKLLPILRGRVSSHIMEPRTEMLSRGWKESELRKFGEVTTCLKNHGQYVKHDEYLAKGYPTGSGVAESACGHPVRDRTEISGAGRGTDGAESALSLRSAVRSEDWDEYRAFFTRQAGDSEFFPDGHNALNVKEKIYA